MRATHSAEDYPLIPFPYGMVWLMAFLYTAFALILLALAVQLFLYLWNEAPATLGDVGELGICVGAVFASLGVVLAWSDQHDAWLTAVQMAYLQERRKRQPRPAVFQSVGAMRNATTLRRTRDSLVPYSAAHYAAIYRNLSHQKWRLTRKALTVKIADVPAFTSLTERYKAIGKHWDYLEWIDGYETGDPNHDTWKLNEIGQQAFIENAGVHLRT